jgi:signal transduction histidine kinase/DNA-binding NarL/FixJ family response regulator
VSVRAEDSVHDGRADAAGSTGGVPWLVVIDDEANDRALAVRALKREFPDARITAIATAAEWAPVREALGEMRTDVGSRGAVAVVTDYRFRWSDGLALLKDVRALCPDCPVVMFTNTGSEDLAVEAMKAGLDDYVIKNPETAPRLARAVRGALDRRAAAARAARAEASAEAARRRAARLQAVTAALARAASPAEVAHAAVHEGLVAMGASTASLAAFPRRAPASPATPPVQDATGRPTPSHGTSDHLELLANAGHDPVWIERWMRIDLTRRAPLSDAVRQGATVWVEGREAMAARYPDLAARTEFGGGGLMAVPLAVRAGSAVRVVGALGASFPESRMLDADERAYFETLGGLAAQALERAWLYEDEQVARREAEAANLAKTQFLATMSHELRTPLNAIQGHVQLVELGIHGDVTAAQRDALERVQRAQRHLLGLIDDVLNYARLESGRVRFDPRAVTLGDVMRDVTAMVEPQLLAKRITFDIARAVSPSASRVRAWADREKLVQVLLNLLSNAIKFTAEGGRVTIGVEEVAPPEGPPLVLVRVRDTGIGIPKDKLETIFEPFVQVDASLTRGIGGTGLGLAISRDLARGMGGELSATSAIGEGSTFTLALKRVEGGEG